MTLGHGRSFASSAGPLRFRHARRTGSRLLAPWLLAVLLLVSRDARAQESVQPVPTTNDSAGVVAGVDSTAAARDSTLSAAPTAPRTDADPGAVPPPAATATAPAPLPSARPNALDAPANLRDLNAWIAYKTRAHVLALPEEARLFYRRGLVLHDSGGDKAALLLVDGAIKLDPGFVAPRFTLMAWLALRQPAEALDQLNAVIRLARDSFMIQIVTAANALYLLIQALMLALVAIAIVVVALNHARLRHGWIERLAPFITPATARWWSWAILLGPYFAGLGPALPTLAFLGMLMPTARLRDRALFVLLALALVGVPFMTATLDRLSSPLHEDRAPFYGVPELQAEPYTPVLRAGAEAAVAAHPANPFLHFAAAWLAQRAGDAVGAEGHYRRALASWPDDDRTYNNLGNTLASQGRSEEALAAYRKAIDLNPQNLAAHFNASQIYTMRYDFNSANDELSRASAIDFEVVKDLQAERSESKWAGLLDQWIAPRTFWHALSQVPGRTAASGALPPLWRTRVECSGWAFSLLSFVVAVVSVGLGLLFHRSLPVRDCWNCGRAVCRRCAQRRRELALCPECAAIWSRAQSPEYGRVLLFQRRRRLLTRRDTVVRVVGTVAPGIGYLPHRKLLRPIAFLSAGCALASATFGVAAPFSYEPRFGVPGHAAPMQGVVLLWLAYYAVSIPIFIAFERRARLEAHQPTTPVRQRADSAGPTTMDSQDAA
jgi:tetratricopeptide (TPR) repeat protein